jgi:hypothetical protein
MFAMFKNKYFILLMAMVLLNARVLVAYADDPETIAVIKTVVSTLDLDIGTVEHKFYLDVTSDTEKILSFDLMTVGVERIVLTTAGGTRKSLVFDSMQSRAPPLWFFVSGDGFNLDTYLQERRTT